MNKVALRTRSDGPVAEGVKDTSPKPLRNRLEYRRAGRVMGTTRKRDLRIVQHPMHGLTANAHSFDPSARKFVKRFLRIQTKLNRDS